LYCSQAVPLEPTASVPLGCVGLASMYLPGVPVDETVQVLQRAMDLKQAEVALVEEARRTGKISAELPTYAAEAAAGVFTSPAFDLTLATLQSNLLTTYISHRRHAQCAEWFREAAALPPLMQGGTHVIVFASTNWSIAAKPEIDRVETGLRASGAFASKVSLWSEIFRVQKQMPLEVLSIALQCSLSLRDEPLYQPAVTAATADFMVTIKAREEAANALPPRPPAQMEPSETRGVVLVLQYYAPTDPARSQDINVALWRNLQNDFITDIYLLNEVQASFRGMPNSHKIHQIVIGERLTFQRAFAFANQHLAGRTVIIGMQALP
jgi:hypothetical protein